MNVMKLSEIIGKQFCLTYEYLHQYENTLKRGSQSRLKISLVACKQIKL